MPSDTILGVMIGGLIGLTGGVLKHSLHTSCNPRKPAND